MNKTVLYLPIEVAKRELRARVLLALEALKHDFIVVIGERGRLRRIARSLPRGIYMYKGFTGRNLQAFRSAGHRTAALDEEGLVFPDVDLYQRVRLDANSFRNSDLLFAWGEFHRQAIVQGHEEHGDKVVAVGNPRIDLLRLAAARGAGSDAERRPLRVLINTRFGVANNSTKTRAEFIAKYIARGAVEGGPELDYYRRKLDHDEVLLAEFRNLLDDLPKRRRDVQFYLRPHPTERMDAYLELCKRHPNLQMASEGEIAPWLERVDVIIHNGCTTAIEAYVLGKTVLTFEPIPPVEGNIDLPGRFGCRVRTLDEVVGMLEPIRAGEVRKSAPSSNGDLPSLLSALDGPLSVELMVRHFREQAALLGRTTSLGEVIRALRPGLGEWRRHGVGYAATEFPAPFSLLFGRMRRAKLQIRHEMAPGTMARFLHGYVAELKDAVGWDAGRPVRIIDSRCGAYVLAAD